MVNPSGKAADFAYDGKLGEALYQNGGDIEQKDGKIMVPAATAVFVREVK